MFSILPYRTNREMAHRPGRGFFDEFAGDFFRPFFDEGYGPMTRGMKVDVRDEGDHYILEADLPGVKREDVKVEVENGVMTIAVNYDENREDKAEDGRYICRERRFGSMSRAFNVEGLREEDITARFEDGVLTLNLPKKEEAQKPAAHTIEIQ